LKFCW